MKLFNFFERRRGRKIDGIAPQPDISSSEVMSSFLTRFDITVDQFALFDSTKIQIENAEVLAQKQREVADELKIIGKERFLRALQLSTESMLEDKKNSFEYSVLAKNLLRAASFSRNVESIIPQDEIEKTLSGIFSQELKMMVHQYPDKRELIQQYFYLEVNYVIGHFDKQLSTREAIAASVSRLAGLE